MQALQLPTDIEDGTYPDGWPLAKATFEAINTAYKMAGSAGDKGKQIQLFG
jgi:hypothetical protein